ncbi:MAG: (2Fe-2S) ferredoxin domain-containing protein [Eubacteriales bacterium]|nr:(2Fe-2S) ferredoxin domain-containing protein [Eubacteriales bacterium]
MKTIQELAQIRQRALDNVNLRRDNHGMRIIVGMATCGIAAGARPVMLKAVEEVQKRGLHNVTVSQTGCIGMCRLEPIMEVFDESGEKVTYVKVEPDMIPRIITEHIVNGRPVKEYTIGYYEENN